MSNKHIENLTVRLLQALDKNYDVVNMDAVLSVIAALENTKITKEQLEATRLAKYINLFRRRTKSEQLAKRAKSLLKKWREMVGMQQRPLGNCNELIRNESTTNSNFQECVNLVEGIPSIHQIPSISHTSNVGNTYSRSLPIEKSSEYHKNVGKVLTSFSNVLAGFSRTTTDKKNLPSFTSQNIANGPSARRKNYNLKRSVDPMGFPEVFAIEHQSNLGSVENCISTVPNKFATNTEPIIIDIEDSNSGSNLVESASVRDKGCKVISPVSEKPCKHKKAKKDKKRTREREFLEDLSTPLVVIDAESSLSQNSNLRKQRTFNAAEKEVMSLTDEKTRSENLIATNISEVLSLSNSSMSSVFPTSSVGATKNIFSQSNRTLSESELSFAGKFAQQSVSAVSPIVSTLPGSSEIKNKFLPYKDVVETQTTAGISSTKGAFQPFIGTSCNSNDSASNSRHSTFEITDYSSQGNKTHQKHTESDLSFPTHRPKLALNKDIAIEGKLVSPISASIQPQANSKVLSGACTTMPEQKVPKKRGRKKGSKGIDSLIAKDTSLSSQMLIQSLGSGGKKVKTTKELYAEMQNRKMGVSTPSTPSHWTGTQSQTFARRDSFCSEPSLHSPRTFDACSTNATVSTIATSSTPEKISVQRHTADIDSGSDSLISGGQSHQSPALVTMTERVDGFQNNSSEKFLKELCKKHNSSNMLTPVENQLRELFEKLPPVPSLQKIDLEIAKDAVSCTCKIFEVLPERTEREPEDVVVGNLLSLEALKASNEITDKENDQPVITISVGRTDANDPQSKIMHAHSNNPVIRNVQEKPIRSIFDLDFDDDEDPLHTLKAEVAAAGYDPRTEEDIVTKIITSPLRPVDNTNTVNFSKDQDAQLQKFENIQNQLTSEEMTTPAFAFPTYKIEEDETCLAKQRFAMQVQKITNFHICALHNCYVPNVNGNFDNATDGQKDGNGSRFESAEQILLSDGSNVVPKFCLFDSEDYIKKDLRKIEFDSNFKPKSRLKVVEKFFYKTPFLGVSRCLKKLKSSHRKTRKHKQGSESEKKRECSLLVNHVPENENQLDNKDIGGDPKTVATKRLAEGEKPNEFFSQCNEKINHIPLTLVFDDITINVDEIIAPTTKENSSSEAQTLLAIAPNVNFNNNQIDTGLVGQDVAAEKNCLNNLSTVAENYSDIDLNVQNECMANLNIDNGDITNNNNNRKQKFEESSCDSSHSSLKQTQKCINIKLRKHRHQIIEQEKNSSKSYSKRKRRRKKSSSQVKRQKITCIKIAINGGITTRRHVQIDDNESESESQASNSDETVRHVTHNRDEYSSELSNNSEVEQETNLGIKTKDGEWEQNKDADTNSDREFVDDEEEYEYDDDEFEEEDEYSGEFHEVVTRDISPSTASGNNHIVLTIKKTPSKTNSPCDSFPPVSPAVSGNKTLPISLIKSEKIEENTEEKSEKAKTEENQEAIKISVKSTENSGDTIVFSKLFQKYMLKHPTFKRKRRFLKRKSERLSFRFPDEVKNERVFKKQHQQLFFPHEIFLETTNGSKKKMFKMSSCSSSCAELSEYEIESSSDKDCKSDNSHPKCDKAEQHGVNENAYTCNNDIASCNDGHSSLNESTTASCSEKSIDDTTEFGNKDDEKFDKDEQHDDKIDRDINDILPEHNNGLLVSFNSICTPSSALEDSVAKTVKCDEICSKDLDNEDKFGNFADHGKNHYLMVADVTVNEQHDSQFVSTLKDRKSIHSVDEDLNNGNGDDNDCRRLQQFKEWHQLLQLRSYNDELLTVLPYVVLE